jgi:hypothetical protein
MNGSRAVGMTILAMLLMIGTLFGADKRPLTVWLIPSEEAEAQATSNSADIAKEIQQFNQLLKDGPVRVLNTLFPLDEQDCVECCVCSAELGMGQESD